MDGLNANEVTISQMRTESESFRFDSCFYDKYIMNISERIKRLGYNELGEVISVLTDYTANGSFAALAKNVNVYNNVDYAKWIRIQNLDKADYINDVRYVDKNSYDFLKKSKLFGGELLISKTGEYLGKAYIYRPENNDCATLADNIFLLESKDSVPKELLFVFINSNVGRQLLLRWIQGTGQPTIIKESIRKLLIPKFKEELVFLLRDYVNKAFELNKQSKDIYSEANRILNSIICCKTFHNKIDLNGKKISEVRKHKFRLDAEYYQSKYAVLFEELSKFNCRSLGGYNGLVDIRKSIEPGSEAYQEDGVPFVRVSNMTEFEISKPDICLPIDYVDDMESLYPKKDTILLSKDGSVGIAHKVNKQMNVVTSGAILHLTVKDTNEVLPDYLALVLNSQIVKLQAERDSNGAIIQHWKPSEIENVVIPLLDMDIQRDIASKVQESFRLREKSKQLLEYAKQAVEMAIEQDEDIAIEWLNEKADLINEC